MNIQTDVPLSPFTNWRIGGPADFFVEISSKRELEEALAEARKRSVPYFILGGGTNILVSDVGFRGMVIKNTMKDIVIAGFKGKIGTKGSGTVRHVFVRADAGVLTNRLVRYACDQAFSGLENFLGQPGTVGGATYINAHNMNKHDFFGDHVVEAEILTPGGELKMVPASYFKFGYDENTIQKTGDVVISVVVALTQESDKKAEIWKKAEDAMNYRHTTQPKGFPTAGCTFRNISLGDALRIGTPDHTRSAGFLIDACGLKGKQIGHAKISPEHANFILNTGGATAADVTELIDLAKTRVKKKFGVVLHEEIVLVGFRNYTFL